MRQLWVFLLGIQGSKHTKTAFGWYQQSYSRNVIFRATVCTPYSSPRAVPRVGSLHHQRSTQQAAKCQVSFTEHTFYLQQHAPRAAASSPTHSHCVTAHASAPGRAKRCVAVVHNTAAAETDQWRKQRRNRVNLVITGTTGSFAATFSATGSRIRLLLCAQEAGVDRVHCVIVPPNWQDFQE